MKRLYLAALFALLPFAAFAQQATCPNYSQTWRAFSGTTATVLEFYAQTSRGYDPANGTVGYSEDVATVSAFVGPLGWKQANSANAAVGDVQALITLADLATAPLPNARFRVASGAYAGTYAVYETGTGPLSTHHIVLAHRAE